MERIIAYAVAIAAVLLGSTAVMLSSGHGSGTVGTGNLVSTTMAQTASTTNNGVQAANQSTQLFSSEQYYPYSYRIAPGSPSQASKAALAGYSMTTSNVSGSENVTISLGGVSKTVSLKGGLSLYVVETSFGDDAPGYEGSTVDDGFVLVNSSGYVISTFVV